jgi:hypothetical protein
MVAARDIIQIVDLCRVVACRDHYCCEARSKALEIIHIEEIVVDRD